MDIGIKIAQARRELGITQVELAEKMNVTRQTVSRWESGTALPDLEKVVNLAEILHVSCDYLMVDSNSNRSTLTEMIEKESTGNNGGVSRLLSSLQGKIVEINFYEDEEDTDAINNKCRVESFEGKWIKITVLSKKGEKSKLIPVSSILSFTIVNGGEQ